MDADLGADDLLAAHPLLQPLTPAQQVFVETLFARVTDPKNDWPVFDYVTRAVRKRGYDAEAELAGFPVVTNRANPGFTYRHIWSDGGGRTLNAGSHVRLTIAGLRAEEGGGPQFAEYLVKVIRLLAELESEIVPNPDAVAEDTPDLEDVLADVQGAGTYRPFLLLSASILDTAWITRRGRVGPSAVTLETRVAADDPATLVAACGPLGKAAGWIRWG